MDPSKRGLSSAAKAGVVVVVAIVVVAGLYLYPGLMKGGSQTTTQGGAVSTVRGNQTVGVYSLVKAFTNMQLVVDQNDVPDQFVTNNTYSYSVLGTGTINSTNYTRVEFVTLGIGDDVVMWFNSTGGVGRVDVLGQRNYTGNGLPNLPYVTTYSNLFGVIPTITNNATLLSQLTQTSVGLTNIGPTQADVTTYELSGTTSAYTQLTVKIATVPSNNVELAVYLFAKTHDKSTELIEVTSLTK